MDTVLSVKTYIARYNFVDIYNRATQGLRDTVCSGKFKTTTSTGNGACSNGSKS